MKEGQHSLKNWNPERWPDFTTGELACRHCGALYIWSEFLDGLQTLRDHTKRPIVILSGHRCAHHNAMVGGAPLSQHLKLAVDIKLSGHDHIKLACIARDCGFSGFGFYNTFLHLDMGRERHWFGGPTARNLWKQL